MLLLAETASRIIRIIPITAPLKDNVVVLTVHFHAWMKDKRVAKA
jgi:hypothetical protein